MTAEADLRARILHAIRAMWPRKLGIIVFGRPASATTGPGHPDLFGIVRGRFLALEVKKAKGKPTDLQAQRLRELRECGAYAWIVRNPEEACHAVYWTAKGWTRPMSSEPLDLGDWLLGEEAKPEPAVEFTTGSTEPDPPFNLTVAPEVWDTPEHQEAAAKVMGFESAEHRNYTAIENQERAAIRAEDDLVRLDKDLRDVGDRVTLVWEQLQTYTAVLSGMHAMLERLMAMVDDEVVPENAEAAFLADNDTADTMGEVPPPPTPRRRQRQRKPKEFVVLDSNGTAQSLDEAVAEVVPESSTLADALKDVLPD